MDCKNCESNKNGWCKKLNTNNKVEKQEKCPYNNVDKDVLISVKNVLEIYKVDGDLIDSLNQIINKY